MNEGVGSIEILGKIFLNLLLGILLFKKLLTMPYPVSGIRYTTAEVNRKMKLSRENQFNYLNIPKAYSFLDLFLKGLYP